jgi:hypothetical protein
MKTGYSGWLDRLSVRERRLVLSVFGIIAVLVVGGSAYYLRGTLNDKEKQIEKNRKTLKRIAKTGQKYRTQQLEYENLISKLKNNPNADNPQLPVMQLARNFKVHYLDDSRGKQEAKEDQMENILRPAGKLKKVELTKRRRNQKKKKRAKVYLVSSELSMNKQWVLDDELFTYLAKVENLNNIFITALYLDRKQEPAPKTNQADYIRLSKMVASTLQYVEAK